MLRYFELGRLYPSNADGQLGDLELTHANSVFYLPDTVATTLGYDLVRGATMTLVELLAPPPLSSSLNPWDRNPAPLFLASYPGSNVNLANTIAWTYTVPAGRKLMVTSASVWALQENAATGTANGYAQMIAAGSGVLYALYFGNVVGGKVSDTLNGGPVILTAGQTVYTQYGASPAGATLAFALELAGTLFDA